MLKMDLLLNIYSLAVIILVPVTVSLYFYFDYKANYWKRKGVQGPKPLPLIGNLWENFTVVQSKLEEQRLLKYGRVYGTLFGWKPVITIAEPELLKRVLITDFRVFMAHREVFAGDPLLSKMLNELTGEEWKRIKAIISPAFSMHKLTRMQPLITQCVSNTLKHFDLIATTKSNIDLKNAALSFTLDTIASCVFGMHTNGFDDPNDEFISRSKQLTELKLWRALTCLFVPPTLRIKFDWQLFPEKHVKYFTYVLKDIIRKRREQTSDGTDFLSLLLNAESDENSDQKKLTENEVIANCLIFLIAGYETTATLLNYTLYVLAMHPNVQQALYDEIRNYFEHHKQIEFDSLNSLPYLNAVICESLRLYTPLTSIERFCCEDYELGNTGITIEKGTILNIPYYAIHHDPELFPNPHQFIAERFLDENKDSIQPYSFIPFGLGPRSCVGNRFSNLSSKIFLASFMHKFEVIKTKNTPDKPVFDTHFAFLNCKPLYVSAKRRL